MIFPKNDSVIARAVADSYRKQYNEALFDILGEVVTGSTLADRIRAFDATGDSILDLIAGAPVPPAPTLPRADMLVYAWESTDMTPVADGTGIAQITDSINGITYDQATAEARPTYKTNAIGSIPSLRFNGTSQFVACATPGALKAAIDTQTFTVLMGVSQIANTASTYGTLFGYTSGAAESYYIVDNNRAHRYNMQGGAAPFTLQGEFCTFGNSSGVGGVLANDGLERVFINGGCVYSYLAKAPGGSAGNFVIGRAGTLPFYGNFDLFFKHVWSVELTPAEVAQYHEYCAYKMALATPWAAMTRFPVFVGDSQTQDGQDNAGIGGTYPYLTAAALGLSYGQWTNLGIGYTTMEQLTAIFATDCEPIAEITGLPSHIAVGEWYNQRADADPVAKSLAYIAAAKASGASVIFWTSMDSVLDPEVARAAYNAAFDADHSMVDYYAPFHLNEFIGVDGATTTHPEMFVADGLHNSSAGCAVKAGLIAPGFVALA